jgi:hypothetical protein
MSESIHRVFRRLPSMVGNYVRVVGGRKPYVAPAGSQGHAIFEATEVRIDPAHLRRYRDVCGIPDSAYLPHAYPHVLAMPLHMHIFTAACFPVKVLGLIHLRNSIRTIADVSANATMRLVAEWQTMRETSVGQEFDLLTRGYVDGALVWDETSTMLARRASPGQRPVIERAGAADAKINLTVAGDTGRRYAAVSGDFNPIHLSARTAGWFGFKQAVAHGMWSMSRTLGAGADFIPLGPTQIDTQFKLPLYLPSEVIFRAKRGEKLSEMSLSSGKGDRMHLAIQVTPVN